MEEKDTKNRNNSILVHTNLWQIAKGTSNIVRYATCNGDVHW